VVVFPVFGASHVITGCRIPYRQQGRATRPRIGGELRGYLRVTALFGRCVVNVEDGFIVRIDDFCRFERPQEGVGALAVVFASA
jgi:hypothetical protein